MIKRTLFFLISFLCFCWLLLPFLFHGILNIGNLTGLAVFFFGMVFAVFYHPFCLFIKKLWGRKVWKAILGAAGGLGALVVVLTLVLSVCMAKEALNRPKEPSTVIVLGCRVYGEDPSLMLIERLEAAYGYLEEHKDVSAVLSGGQGPGEAISEAECMYRYLVEKGIDKERLYKEENSTSTRENLLFFKKILEEQVLFSEQDSKQVIVITNEFHQYRAARIARNLELEPKAVSGKTAWWLFPTYYVRELYGILYEWLV